MTTEELKVVKNSRHREWLWVFAMFTFFLGAVLWEGYGRLTLDKRPPINGEITLVATPQSISQGKSLLVRAIRDKVRGDCSPLLSERWAVSIATGETIQLASRVWAGGSDDEGFVDLLFDTSKLPPGDYQGYARATYPCPGIAVPFVYNATFHFSIVGL